MRKIYFVWLFVKHYFIFWFVWLPFIFWECLKEGNPLVVLTVPFFHILYSPLMVISEADKELKRVFDD